MGCTQSRRDPTSGPSLVTGQPIVELSWHSLVSTHSGLDTANAYRLDDNAAVQHLARTGSECLTRTRGPAFARAEQAADLVGQGEAAILLLSVCLSTHFIGHAARGDWFGEA